MDNIIIYELAEQIIAKNSVDLASLTETSVNSYELASIVKDSFGRCTRYFIDLKVNSNYMLVEVQFDVLNNKVIKLNISQIRAMYPSGYFKDVKNFIFEVFPRTLYLLEGDEWANYVTTPLLRFKEASYNLAYLDPIIENILKEECIKELETPTIRTNFFKSDIISHKFKYEDAPSLPVITNLADISNV